MAYLHQPLSLNQDTYATSTIVGSPTTSYKTSNMTSSGSTAPQYTVPSNNSYPSAHSQYYHQSTQSHIPNTLSYAPNAFSAYNPTFSKGQERGQMPLVLVSKLPTGADLRSFEDEEDDEEDISEGTSVSEVTSEGTAGFEILPRVSQSPERRNRDMSLESRRPRENAVDVVGTAAAGEGYGANVRSVAGYYRMPITSPTLPLIPGAAVAKSSQYTPSNPYGYPTSTSPTSTVPTHSPTEAVDSITCHCGHYPHAHPPHQQNEGASQ